MASGSQEGLWAAPTSQPWHRLCRLSREGTGGLWPSSFQTQITAPRSRPRTPGLGTHRTGKRVWLPSEGRDARGHSWVWAPACQPHQQPHRAAIWPGQLQERSLSLPRSTDLVPSGSRAHRPWDPTLPLLRADICLRTLGTSQELAQRPRHQNLHVNTRIVLMLREGQEHTLASLTREGE